MLAIGNDYQFAQFCRCAGHPEWSSDSRFSSNPQRVTHREVLIPMLSAVTRTRSTPQWTEALQALGVPCGPINDLAQVFADPQVVARGLRTDFSSVAGRGVPSIASPLRLSAAPVQYRLPPPALGEHTRRVLEDILGLAPAELDELARDGAI